MERKIISGITEGNLVRSIWKLSLPIMAGGILQNTFSLVDMFFVGKLGYVAIGALSLSGAILAILVMAVIGITAGSTALIAHFIGKKEYSSADRVLNQTIILSFISWIFMILIGIWGIEPLIALLGGKGEVEKLAGIYLRISFYGSIFIFLFVCFNQSLRGAGDTLTPLKFLLLSNLINIALDPFLILGIGFFPRMEIAGSALATLISRAIGVVLLIFYLHFGNSAVHLRISRDSFKIIFPIMNRITKIGVFASLQAFLRQISFLLLIRLVNFFGVTTLAAYGIGSRLRFFLMILGFSFGGASAILMGQNMGAKKVERAVRTGWRSLILLGMISIPLATLFIVFSPYLVKIFTQKQEVINIGVNFLRITLISLPFLLSSILLSRGFSGVGDTFFPTVLTGIFQLFFKIYLAYLFSIPLSMGTNGIWLGIALSDFLQSIAFVWYYKKGMWKKVYFRHRRFLEENLEILT